MANQTEVVAVVARAVVRVDFAADVEEQRADSFAGVQSLTALKGKVALDHRSQLA